MTSIEPDHNQPPPHHFDDHPARLTTDSARQGPWGKRILYVLAGSVFGSIIIAGAAFLRLAAKADRASIDTNRIYRSKQEKQPVG